jgi:N-acetylglucosaminyldiphosphoundecaprenol N-acetyl-beta-D-mannosaminyltransferase
MDVVEPSAGKAKLFGAAIDRVSMEEAVAIVSEWLNGDPGPCRYVVTPNVDHIVQLQHDQDLRQAYANASLVIADGWPLVAAARLLGRPVPERVAGSDLVPRLFAAASPERPLRAYLLGAAPGVAERAAARIEQTWPNVSVVGTNSPPQGFDADSAQCDAVLQLIAAAQPQLLVVGLGAPKQEIWLNRYHPRLAAKVAIAAGATIDFLAGEQTRAPRWVQRLYLEWLYRIGTDPKRLTIRYLRDAWHFPRIVAKEWFRKPS